MLTRATRARLAAQEGFTLATAMGVMLVVLLLSAAAYAEVDGDLLPQRQGEERRQAYAAAEAGVNDFLSRLLRDNSYWTKCSDPENPSLSRPANRATRTWADVGPGTTAQFTVEMLPANGFQECTPSDPRSVLDDATGTFRIRVTGRPSAASTCLAGSTVPCVRRSLVTTFRPRGFLNYIYLTEYETRDPALTVLDTFNMPTRRSATDPQTYPAWIAANCATRYRAQRGATTQYQRQQADGSWETIAGACPRIQFATDDEVRGPFHTNDDVIICGTPTFGRAPKDRIEVGGTGSGWSLTPGCSSGTPDVNFPGSGQPLRSTVGTWVAQAPRVGFPPTNAGLRNDAEVRLKGATTITFNGGQMTVTSKDESGAALNGVTMAVPRDGVIYVSNDASAGACLGYQPWNTSATQAACGDVQISGTFGANVTVGAENDIVVTGDLVRQNDAFMLGLIPNHWARVAHPATRTNGTRSCTNGAGTRQNITIDAAILALQNSFVVDNYDCGAKLGTLLVRGAIAQRYRGPVGTTNTGYTKDYRYDARLERRSPPRYINPVEPPWAIAAQSEQVPATR